MAGIHGRRFAPLVKPNELPYPAEIGFLRIHPATSGWCLAALPLAESLDAYHKFLLTCYTLNYNCNLLTVKNGFDTLQ